MTEQNPRLGIGLMVLTTFIFAIQDGISRHLSAEYNVLMVVMVRYWFFGLFVLALAYRQPGGFRSAVHTTQPVLQIIRGLLLIAEICVLVYAFVHIGLVESHAIFASYPLLVAALSGPILGEYIGWRRWSAIFVGFVGVLIILQPGYRALSPFLLIPLGSAFMFALYSLLTRYVARRDSATTSFFWTGISGAIAITGIGIWFWQPMTGADWIWMLCLSITGIAGHFCLIKCYEVSDAGSVQPFAYLQMVFAAAIGLLVFSEDLRSATVIGAALIILAGLFTIRRSRKA
jgi:drug/metabolite transporter (DMT)-like permease